MGSFTEFSGREGIRKSETKPDPGLFYPMLQTLFTPHPQQRVGLRAGTDPECKTLFM
jgi:hypothetical protein